MYTLEDLFLKAHVFGPTLSQARWNATGDALCYLKAASRLNASEAVADSPLALWQCKASHLSSHSGLDQGEIQVCAATQLFQSGLKPKDLTDAEKDLQERKRVFSTGITQFEPHPLASHQFLLSMQGSLLEWDATLGHGDLLHEGGAFYAQYSPSGNQVSFIENDALYVLKKGETKPKFIAGPSSHYTQVGVAEFVAQEELSRFEGVWWSSDDRYLAYQTTHDLQIPVTQRQEIYAHQTKNISQRYPFVGGPNAQVGLQLFDLREEKHFPILELQDDFYLARAGWLGDSFVFVMLNRLQNHLKMFRFDLNQKKSILFFEEKKVPFINIFCKKLYFWNRQLIWHGEEEYGAIYAIDPFGLQTFKKVTPDSHQVASLLDAKGNVLLYSALHNNALERKAFVLNLESQSLFPIPHTHRFVDSGSLYSDSKTGEWHGILCGSDLTQSAVFSYFKMPEKGKSLSDLNPFYVSKMREEFSKCLFTPEFSTFSHDGHRFNSMCISPPVSNPHQKFPAIVYLYGGPHKQVVQMGTYSNDWLFAQYLCSLGFVVFSMDNRGTPYQGYSFESAIYQKMGQIDVEDQAAGVEYLKSFPHIDAQRLGVFGWSYGGFLTLMCLLKKPDLFKVGVSGAPVTDFRMYDTCYTERYMGLPSMAPEAYGQTDASAFASTLKARLLLIHGMADDNVLFDHSIKMADALYENQKTFEPLFYPGEKHAIARPKRRLHKYQSIARFFKEYL